MHYIVIDFEFNQKDSSVDEPSSSDKACPYEIIQIGAVKLNSHWELVEEYNRFIKPTIHTKLSPFITELTGITSEQLENETSFPNVYDSFLKFVEGPDAILCSWGKSDIKELYRNVEYFRLDQASLPKLYINLQPYASIHLNQPRKKLLKLSYTVEALGIPLIYPFHNALYDAYYTAEIFKRIMNPTITPSCYDPIRANLNIKPRQIKRKIDFDSLIKQFEKMYQRPMSEEEQQIIKLAYQMGKTGQFIREETGESS